MKRLKLALFVCWSCFVLLQVASAANPQEVLKSITRLAHANDWMSDELLVDVKQLRASADELFPIFSQIIDTSTEDAVLNVTLSIASEARANRGVELSEMAARILSKRDPALFPLVTQRALATLGASGDRRYIPLLKAFSSNQGLLVRTAAESALASLDKSQKSPPSSEHAQPVPLPPLSQQAPTIGADEMRKPATHGENQPSSTPWSVVAVLIVAAVGLLWLLLKGRK